MTTKKAVLIVFVAAGLLIIAAGMSGVFRASDSVVCTMDAKMCPDGSYVGRTGPKCEFTACPGAGSTDPTLGWKTSTNPTSGITFKYPEALSYGYIHPVAWPPVVSVKSGVFLCKESGSEVIEKGKTQIQVIGGNQYCVTLKAEGAAGSTYTEYTYVFQKSGKIATVAFTLRAPQCGNYDEPKRGECTAEQTALNMGTIVNTMAGTLTFAD